LTEITQTPQQTQQTPEAQAFVDYLYKGIAAAIETWDAPAARDIYVVWILLALHEDDARFAEVTAVGYGTTVHTTPDLEESYGSKWNPGCWAGGTDLNLCHPSDAEYADIYGIEDKHDFRWVFDQNNKLGCHTPPPPPCLGSLWVETDTH
jgi:hypothetical protein